MPKAVMTIEEALRHVGTPQNAALADMDVEEMASKAIPHYIWIEPKGGLSDGQGWPDMTPPDSMRERHGKCTACNGWLNVDALADTPDWVLNDPYVDHDVDDEFDEVFHRKVKGTHKHKDYGYCPLCGAKIQFRSLGYSRKSLVDKLFLIVYRKSAIEPESIIMLGYEVTVPWRKMDEYDEIRPPIEAEAKELCVFRYGKGAERFIRRWNYYADEAERDERGRVPIYRFTGAWERRGNCISGYNPGAGAFNAGMRVKLDKASFNEAIAETLFERAYFEDMDAQGYFDRIGAMAAIAKYPCLEYMHKMGMDGLVQCVVGGGMGRLLNLRGKTARQVLKLTESEWGEVKGKGLKVTREGLEGRAWVKRRKLRLDMDYSFWIGKGYGKKAAFDEIASKWPELPMVKIIKYCRKRNVEARDMLDYLGQMKDLQMDMRDKSLLFPRDFNEMHARLTERLSHKQNAEKDKQIRKRLDDLNGYCFSAYGLVLRPFVSTGEVIAEGNALKHCVGGYAGNYAAGSIVLCALRDEAEPGKPLYTVEFSKTGKRVQCRGFKNKEWPEYEERAAAFWKLYDAMRGELLKPKGKKKKGRNAA